MYCCVQQLVVAGLTACCCWSNCLVLLRILTTELFHMVSGPECYIITIYNIMTKLFTTPSGQSGDIVKKLVVEIIL